MEEYSSCPIIVNFFLVILYCETAITSYMVCTQTRDLQG